VGGISRTRLAWGIFAIIVLVVSAVGVTLAVTTRPSSAVTLQSPPTYQGAGAAVHTGSAAALAGAGTGVASAGTGTDVVTAVTSPTVSYPTWCCSAGNPLGLTVTGEATVRGNDATARSAAIASAVADAEAQAKAVAHAAGISLGRIINIEVSTPYYPYPIPLGAARAGNTTNPPPATGASGAPGSGAPTPECPAGSECAYPAATTYASVTVTWAIS
jgi:hypothetical protein